MKNVTEAIAGLLVLVVAIGFMVFAYKGANINNSVNNYAVIAKFAQADGIAIGSDVKISGVKIGHVSKEYLDNVSYKAVLELSISNNIKLPIDSSAQIVSDGLLGGKYLSISVGADDKMLTSGQEIKFTQSSVNIESLIGKMIFNSPDKNEK